MKEKGVVDGPSKGEAKRRYFPSLLPLEHHRISRFISLSLSRSHRRETNLSVVIDVIRGAYATRELSAKAAYRTRKTRETPIGNVDRQKEREARAAGEGREGDFAKRAHRGALGELNTRLQRKKGEPRAKK